MNPTLSRRDWIRSFAGSSVAAAAWSLARSPIGAFGAPATSQAAGGGEIIPFIEPQHIDIKGGAINWPELREWITPMGDFFNVSHYGMKTVNAEGWKLNIAGLVEKPIALTLDQIKARPKKEITATLECSGNGASAKFMGAIGNAKWAGTPLAALLQEAGVSPDAVEIAFWGADQGQEKIRNAAYDVNFARCLTVKQAERDDILLAYEMNGEPLTTGHGFPLRLVVPGWYGIAWVKWLQTIEARDRSLRNRFMARDYVTLRGEERDGKILYKESLVGPMNVKSLVARVGRAKDSTIVITGAAWTDGTPLKVVEVKIDDGPWRSAKIDAAHDEAFTWRFWSLEWNDAKPGEHTLVSRAIDQKGRIQPAADDPAIALKKTYWEANAQVPRRVKL